MRQLGSLLPQFIRRRVGLQLVVVSGSVLAVAALVSGTFTAESQKRVVLAEVERQGQMLATVLAMCCVDPLLARDAPVLRAHVASLVDTDRVTWAQIVRADGVVMATSGDRSSEVRGYSAPILAPGNGDAPEVPPRPALGVVHVELSTRHANHVAAASSRLLFNQWGMTFVALALALWVVFRFVVHSRLDRLARQAMRLGGGDLQTPIVLTTPDEFGQLASTLDSVRRRLQASYQELQERNTQLQELDRLKSEFLANVSHEIRTPLNGILGFSEVLQHHELDADVGNAIETIFVSACGLRNVVDDVLEFSKLEAGEVSIVPEPVMLRELLADVAQLYAQAAWQKGIELVLDVLPNVPRRVEADPHRLRQIVANLLNNAVKFTDRGEIVLSAEVSDAPQPMLTLAVQDTGIGFESQQRDRLFQSFRQLDGTVSRRYGGTGLGLAIARHLVERMGGTIDAQSQAGVGSRFWFEIPCTMVEEPTEAAAKPGMVAVLGARERLRCALAHEVQALGYVSIAGANVDGCDGRGQSLQAVLLILDGPPDGYAAQVAAARARMQSPSTRVLAVVPPSTSSAADAIGADAIVTRPVRASRLQQALARDGADAPRRVHLEPVVPALRSARVLVVDDNAVNCRVAAAMLTRLGHAAIVSHSGEDALEVLRRGTDIDVILMDCQMPDMDGFEATRRIRATPGEVAGTPIIALTANNLSGDRERCLAAGMDDYLAKPIELARLGTAIERWTAAVGAGSAPTAGSVVLRAGE